MSEFFEREPEAFTAPVMRLSNLNLSSGYKNRLRSDFELLAKAGVSNPICFGGVLRDLDHDHTPRDFDYIGGLPVGSDLEKRVTKVTGALLRQLTDQSMVVEIDQPTQSARLKFNHMGRKIDLGLVSGKVPSVLQMADHGSIGLCAIASDFNGSVYASARYFSDKENKTLTIRGDLSPEEQERAIARVLQLQGGKYKGYAQVIVPRTSVVELHKIAWVY